MQRSQSHEKILIVDPEMEAGQKLVLLLEQYGFDTDLLTSSSAALEYLIARPDCHLVISPLDLGSLQGPNLLESVVRDCPGVLVILTSDDLIPDLCVEAFRRGAADILRAPLVASILLPAVQRALEQARIRRQMLTYRDSLEQLIGRRTRDLRKAVSNLEDSYDITLEAMGDALDLRDEETEGHSKRVTAYTIALARALHLSSAELKTIARGAFLHDIGKIAIPDAILLKPARLTPEETELMQTHCERGYAMIRKISFLREASEIVLAHQERFDGTGYPRGLRGMEIPLGARIFAIADTLDAITSDRPYRKGSSFADALNEIERCSGTQFDPLVVNAFLAMPRKTWPIIRAEIGRHSHASELVRSAAA